MPNINPLGHFRGLSMIQTNGKVGGYKNVFVNLVGAHNDLVYPHFGGKVMNPPKGRAKMFAGDLLEYRPQTGSDDLNPEIYILRTFEVADAVSSSTTIYIKRDEFRHKPFVGDVLMVAPAVIGGTGKAVTVTAVSATSATISEVSTPVWQLTVSANMTITKGAIMVEAEEAGSNKKMLVKAINGVFDCDCDFLFEESVADVANTNGVVTDGMADFYKARYQYTPALGGLMWIHKMSPMPQCVLNLNMCNIPGWYHVDWTLNGKKVALSDDSAAIESAVDGVVADYFLSGASDPTTSTAGKIGATYISTGDNGIFKCVAIGGTSANPTYTWVEVTVS